MKRVPHPSIQEDPDVSDKESPAKRNLPQPDLSSDSHVPSYLPTTDRHTYQKKIAMARETLATHAKKQSDDDTTSNEALSSAAF